jgi:uncharacterized protein (TIGR02391 family)
MDEIFTQSQLEAIARALGDTEDGLANGEIADLLRECGVADDFAGTTKWRRIHQSLWNKQCVDRHRRATLAFIRKAMKPERHLKAPERFRLMRSDLNTALAFAGLEVGEDGTLHLADRATTVTEAQQRADSLRAALQPRQVHERVLSFCRAELIVDNYFHAVLETVKSIFDRIRELSGIDADGAPLVDRVFLGDSPVLAINSLAHSSERSEQTGFAHILKGVYGMFRNPSAHEPRVNWPMSKDDAADLLTLASLIHRRLDSARRLG